MDWTQKQHLKMPLRRKIVDPILNVTELVFKKQKIIISLLLKNIYYSGQNVIDKLYVRLDRIC